MRKAVPPTPFFSTVSTRFARFVVTIWQLIPQRMLYHRDCAHVAYARGTRVLNRSCAAPMRLLLIRFAAARSA